MIIGGAIFVTILFIRVRHYKNTHLKSIHQDTVVFSEKQRAAKLLVSYANSCLFDYQIKGMFKEKTSILYTCVNVDGRVDSIRASTDSLAYENSYTKFYILARTDSVINEIFGKLYYQPIKFKLYTINGIEITSKSTSFSFEKMEKRIKAQVEKKILTLEILRENNIE